MCVEKLEENISERAFRIWQKKYSCKKNAVQISCAALLLEKQSS